MLGVQTKPSFVTYPLLYFTTNFCESTFSMSSPDTGRVGDRLGARHHMIRNHSDTCPRLNHLKAVVDICLPFDAPRLITFVKLLACCDLQQENMLSPLHFLREAVDLPMREAPILDWLAMTLPPLAVLGLVL